MPCFSLISLTATWLLSQLWMEVVQIIACNGNRCCRSFAERYSVSLTTTWNFFCGKCLSGTQLFCRVNAVALLLTKHEIQAKLVSVTESLSHSRPFHQAHAPQLVSQTRKEKGPVFVPYPQAPVFPQSKEHVGTWKKEGEITAINHNPSSCLPALERNKNHPNLHFFLVICGAVYVHHYNH